MEVLTLEDFYSITQNLINPEFPQGYVPKLYQELLSRPNLVLIVLQLYINSAESPPQDSKVLLTILDSCMKRILRPENYKLIFDNNKLFLLQQGFIDLSLNYFRISYRYIWDILRLVKTFTENLDIFSPIYEQLKSSDNIYDKYKLIILHTIFFKANPNQESYSELYNIITQLYNSSLLTDDNHNFFGLKVYSKVFKSFLLYINSFIAFFIQPDSSLIDLSIQIIHDIIELKITSKPAIKIIQSILSFIIRMFAAQNLKDETELYAQISTAFLDPLLHLIIYLEENCFTEAVDEVQIALNLIYSCIFSCIDYSQHLEVYLQYLQNSCIIPDIANYENDANTYFPYLFDETSITYDNINEDMRTTASKIFNRIIKNNQSERINIIMNIFQNGINPQNTFLFAYYIQKIIKKHKQLPEEEVNRLGEIANEIISLNAEDDMLMFLSQILVFSITPYFGNSEFPSDLLETHMQQIQEARNHYFESNPNDLSKTAIVANCPCVSVCVLTLFFRFVRNTLLCGMDVFSNEETLQLINEYRSVALLASDSLAYAEVSKKIGDVSIKYFSEQVGPIYEKIMAIVAEVRRLEEEDDEDFDVDDFSDQISELSNEFRNICEGTVNLLDANEFLNHHFEYVQQLDELDMEYREFALIASVFLKNPAAIPAVMIYTIKSLSLQCRNTLFVSQLLADALPYLWDNPESIFVDNIAQELMNQLLSHFTFRSKFIKQGPNGQEITIVSLGDKSYLEGSDLEPVAILFSLIIERYPGENDFSQVINTLCEAFSTGFDSAEKNAFICLVIFSAVRRYDFIPSPQVLDTLIENSTTGYYESNFTRVLAGTALQKLAQIQPHRQADCMGAGTAILQNAIEINNMYDCWMTFPDYHLLIPEGVTIEFTPSEE